MHSREEAVRGECGRLVRRFVPPNVDMLDHEPAVLGCHLSIVLFGDRIRSAFGALLEHLGLFSEGRRIVNSCFLRII